MRDPEGGEPCRAKVVVPHRNPWLFGAIALVSAAYVSFCAAFSGGMMLVMAVYTSAMLLWGWWRRNWRPRRVAAIAEGSTAGLRLDGALVPRETLRDGVLVPRHGAPLLVRIRRRARPAIELEMEDEGAARGLLRALGLDVGHAVATFRAGSRFVRYQAPLLVGFGVLMVAAMGWMGGSSALGISPDRALHGTLAVLAVGVLALLPIAVPSTIVVGADGLVIRWLGSQRVVPFAEVVGLELRPVRFLDTVMLEVKQRSGRVDAIALHPRTADAEAVLLRLREAMALKRGEACAGVSVEGLARRGRALPAWIASLRAIGAGAHATHRDAAVAPESLWRVVEDAAVDGEARAAAAVALTSDLDDAGRSRLRAAARSIAAPRLRIALDAAAGADEAALAEALAALEEDEARGTAR
jgi:hypothetical protein